MPHGDDAVAALREALKHSPDNLLKKLKTIEAAMGRKRVKGKRWGSRIIDLDILFYGSLVLRKRTLKVPHPEMEADPVLFDRSIAIETYDAVLSA